MNYNSRNYGPVQVRDLSESWSETEEKVLEHWYDTTSSVFMNQSWLSGMSMSTLSLEYTFSQYLQLHSQANHENSSVPECTPIQGKRKPSSTWIGALQKSVRGSIPSSVIRSVASAPIYNPKKLSGQTQPLNEITVEDLDYNNGS